MSTTTKFGLPGIYNTSLPTLNDQDGAALAIDVNGKVILGGSTATIGAVVGNVASGVADSGAPVKVGAVYNSAQQTFTTGQRTDLQSNVNGYLYTDETFAAGAEDNANGVFAYAEKSLAVSTYSPTAAQSNSFTTTNLKASAGNLLGFICQNTTGSDRYLQFHNTATTPSGGGTAQNKFLIPAGAMVVLGKNDWGGPLYFATGIAYANSTVASTYTAGTAGDLLLDVQYK